MGSRGKKRRRASGELAVSRPGNLNRPAPLMLNFSDEPMDPVLPEMLARALKISHKHIPISGITGYEEDEEDAAFQSAFDAMEADLGDETLARKVDSRLYLLREFLKKRGSAYYSVNEDGGVAVVGELLEYAATGPLTEHPDEQIDWSPKQDA